MLLCSENKFDSVTNVKDISSTKGIKLAECTTRNKMNSSKKDVISFISLGKHVPVLG